MLFLTIVATVGILLFFFIFPFIIFLGQAGASLILYRLDPGSAGVNTFVINHTCTGARY